MNKRLTVLLAALIFLLTVIILMPMGTAVSATQTDSFTDVPADAFYYDAVNWAVEQNITQGMGAGQFRPGATCNRAQVVTFLWRLDGKPATAGENIFTDVEIDSWYDDAVMWAVEQNITNGIGGSLFQPDGTCNRAQIVTFLWRYAGKPSANAENPFTDVEEGSWYADAVAWAVENGITTGLSQTSFGPNEPCNRAQVVTFLYRYAVEAAEPPATEPPVTEPTEPDWGIGDVEL